MITLQSRKLIKTIDETPSIFDKVDLNLVYSPIHRKILQYAKILYEHKQPCSVNYLKDVIRAKMSKPNADRSIKEIDDIHTHDYWIGGDINSILRTEYRENVFMAVKSIMEDIELEDDQKIKKMEKIINGASEHHDSVDIHELIDNLVDYAENPSKGEVIKRFKINDVLLNDIFGEYIYASPYLIAGRPGDYKTSLLIYLIHHLNQMGYHGLHFSLEDSKHIFGVKYSAINYNITKNDIFANTIPDKNLVHMKLNKPDGHTHVYDRGIDKDDFKRTIRDHVRRYKIEFVTLDYVQLVRTHGMSKHEGLGEFSYMVMEVCKEFELPVIMTAQLNRENEGMKPKLGNIKDCGSLEQDARYLYALWNSTTNSENNLRNLSILKDSTKGLGDYQIVFNSQVGSIKSISKTKFKTKNKDYLE